MPLNNITAA